MAHNAEAQDSEGDGDSENCFLEIGSMICALYIPCVFSFCCSVSFLQFTGMITYGIRRFLFFFSVSCPVFPPRSLDCVFLVSIGSLILGI